MKDYGSGFLAQRLDKKTGGLQGPVVLQLVRWRNVSRPKIPEHLESDGLCKLTLTDGVTAVDVLQMEPVQGLSGRTPFGTKLLLTGRVPYESGMLLLGPGQCRVLGGNVEKLVEKWQALRVCLIDIMMIQGQQIKISWVILDRRRCEAHRGCCRSTEIQAIRGERRWRAQT